MKLEKEKISIIMPTCNRASLLSGAIQSVLAQDYNNWELLIIGDYCTDDTESVVKSFSDSRIKFWNLPERHGYWGSYMRNFGVEKATGTWLAFLDDDNEYLPIHLSDLHKLATKQGADLVYCSTVVKSRLMPNYSIKRQVTAPRRDQIDTSEIMYRKSCANHKWTPHYDQDWLFVNTLLKKGVKWAHSDKVSLIYYKHSNFLFSKEIMLCVCPFNVADFDALQKIKEERPDFRVTLAITPEKLKKGLLRSFAACDWIETIPYGWSGVAKECLKWEPQTVKEVLNHYHKMGYTTRGFKAPGWQIDPKMYNILASTNYWIYDHPDAKPPERMKVFCHDWDMRSAFPEKRTGLVRAYCPGNLITSSEIKNKIMNVPDGYTYSFISDIR